MKKIIGVSVVAVLFSLAAYAAQGVYGSWALMSTQQGPFSFEVTFTVDKDTITMKNVCSVNGLSTEAQVKVPATISGSSINILQGRTDHQSKNGVDCNVEVTASVMNYTVSADDSVLTLSMPGQNPISIHRK